jgi:hypothetical protein
MYEHFEKPSDTIPQFCNGQHPLISIHTNHSDILMEGIATALALVANLVSFSDTRDLRFFLHTSLLVA